MYDVNRFVKAQDNVYENVINELKKGRKRTHWMWFIFPQLKGLGFSDIAVYYGIENIDEAKEYINNEVLYRRYIECCNILLELDDDDIYNILGDIDGLKLKSSLTLFSFVDVNNKELFFKLLDKYYDGEK